MLRVAQTLAVALSLFAFAPSAQAQTRPGVDAPGLWDLRSRPEKPDLGERRVLRVLTDDDYPPFHYLDSTGQLAGFNVDIARALCDALKLACTVQARRWDTLVDSLLANAGDAVVASLAITPAARAKVLFTAPYYRTPARFVARSADAAGGVRPADLAGKTILVVRGSAHAALLAAFFPTVELRAVTDLAEGETLLRRGEGDALFGDGVSLALWLNGADGQSCCAFRGGPFLESRFVGEGVGIAVRPDDVALRRALDWALHDIWERGVYGRLYLKHFPVGFY